MLQETDIIQYSDASKKCPKCGLRSFPNISRCNRCKSDLSPSLKSAKDERPSGDNFAEDRPTASRFAWITTALAVMLLGLGLVYMGRGSQASAVAVSEAFAQPASPASDQPAHDSAQQNSAQQNSESEAAAAKVIMELKHFQDAAESGRDYKDYEQKLTSLKADLNNTLPSFARHTSNDETFRQEVAAALRDYSAAQNWWKTTLTNSSVFTEADRDERTLKNWASARSHLTIAEKMLAP